MAVTKSNGNCVELCLDVIERKKRKKKEKGREKRRKKEYMHTFLYRISLIKLNII